MTPEQEQRLFTTLGYIRKGLKNNTRAIEKQNGNVADLTKRVNKHDIVLGKVGLGISLGAFFITLSVNGVIAWLKLFK